MRTKKILTTVLALILCLFCISGCGLKKEEYHLNITQMPQYKTLTRNPVKIRVVFTYEYIGEFELTDEESINTITSYLFDQCYYGYNQTGDGRFGWSLFFTDQDGVETEVRLSVKYKTKYTYDLVYPMEFYKYLHDKGFELGKLIAR